MKRGIITNNGHGIHISDGGEVWMTAWENSDLFYTTAGVINSRIKSDIESQHLKGGMKSANVKLEEWE